MTRGKLIKVAIDSDPGNRQSGGTDRWRGRPRTPPPVGASFKSSVDMVRIAAVVRDRKGRFVAGPDGARFRGPRRRPDAADHAISGTTSPASASRCCSTSAAAWKGTCRTRARRPTHVLSWLDATRDEAAVFTFDTHLDERAPFTTGLRTLPDAMTSVVPFGATSLHDAIALTARRVGEREGRRRAVVVLTDGADNASRLKPAEVSAHRQRHRRAGLHLRHRAVDRQPVGRDVDADRSSASALAGPLADLAAWTGGHVFVASTPGQRSVAARQIIDELRHQYLIAFESSGKPGWHPLVVRARNKDLTVRARSGYIAGQSRPTSH